MSSIGASGIGLEADLPVNLDANISHARHATPDELVALASCIWTVALADHEARDPQRQTVEERDASNEALLSRLCDENKDFGQSFPMVLRWMAQFRKYRAAAFRRYLQHVARTDAKDRKVFLKLQAEYPTELMREETPHLPERNYIAFRDNLVKNLEEEDKFFEKCAAETEKEVEALKAEGNDERRAALLALLLRSKFAAPSAATTDA